MVVCLLNMLTNSSQETTLSVFSSQELLMFSHMDKVTCPVLVRLDDHTVNMVLWYIHGLFDGVVDCANLGDVTFPEIVDLFGCNVSSFLTE